MCSGKSMLGGYRGWLRQPWRHGSEVSEAGEGSRQKRQQATCHGAALGVPPPLTAIRQILHVVSPLRWLRPLVVTRHHDYIAYAAG